MKISKHSREPQRQSLYSFARPCTVENNALPRNTFQLKKSNSTYYSDLMPKEFSKQILRCSNTRKLAQVNANTRKYSQIRANTRKYAQICSNTRKLAKQNVQIRANTHTWFFHYECNKSFFLALIKRAQNVAGICPFLKV